MIIKTDNIFIQILKYGWDKFKSKYPSYATEYYSSVVEKVIQCRDPQFGYVEYRCMNCGSGFHKVGFSCKNKFCIHCSRKSSNDFI
ncbi:MAG: transposase zinc-binding domain-containing protein [Oligoflexia bacterium]|nr:transposase zinc-binding domain-containing protein [Oligoflexia bacterium]